MLKDAEECWRSIRVSCSQAHRRSLTDHWYSSHLCGSESQWRHRHRSALSIPSPFEDRYQMIITVTNLVNTWTTSHVIILELTHVEPCVAAWCFSAAFCIRGEHLEMLHAAVERFSFLRDAIRLLSLWSTLVGWVFGGMASRKNGLIAGTFSQGLHRHSVHYTFATGQPATVTLLFCVCKEEVGVILWIHFCFSRSRDLHTAEWQLGSQLKRLRQNEISLSLSLYLSPSPRLSAPWMLCMQHLSMTVAPYSFA